MKRIKSWIGTAQFLFSQGSFSKNVTAFSLLSFLNVVQGVLEGSSYFFFLVGISVLSGDGLRPSFLFFPVLDIGFYRWIAMGVFSQLLRALISLVSAWLASYLMDRVQWNLQTEILNRICFLRYAKACAFRSGELTEIVRYPMINVPLFLEHFYYCFSHVFMVIATLSVLFAISWKLTLFMILCGSLLYFFQRKIKHRLVNFSADEIAESNALISKLVEMISNIKVLHLFNLKKSFSADFKSSSQKLSNDSRKIFFLNHLPTIYIEFAGVFFIALCFLSASYFLDDTSPTFLPILITFAGSAYRLISKLNAFNTVYMSCAQENLYIDRCRSFLDSTQKDMEPEGGAAIGNFQKSINFSNVSFRYSETSQDILSSFSLNLAKGQTIAIVGDSGTGKSTLLDLLMGLYIPNKGVITIDGQDIHKHCLSSWRGKIGVVSQDSAIFNDTLYNNIIFGNLTASNDDFMRAVEIARVMQFAEALPEKYNTVLGEKGYKLSGGEKQRVSLARALIRSPEILVLDEATSHLDSLAEKFIQESIHELKGSITIVIVAHRLSSVMHADTIYVLKRGTVVESGSHEELLAKGNYYAQMWHTQFLSSHEHNMRYVEEAALT